MTPCDLFPLLRGRTLWLMGDSMMQVRVMFHLHANLYEWGIRAASAGIVNVSELLHKCLVASLGCAAVAEAVCMPVRNHAIHVFRIHLDRGSQTNGAPYLVTPLLQSLFQLHLLELSGPQGLECYRNGAPHYMASTPGMLEDSAKWLTPFICEICRISFSTSAESHPGKVQSPFSPLKLNFS